MSYQQLTQDDRAMFYALRKANFSNGEIAKITGKDKTTVGREFNRNSGKKGYRHKQAQKKAETRKTTSGKHIKWNKELEKTIIALLIERLSPVQISNRLKMETGQSISHERIYQFIAKDKTSGGYLYTYLRQGSKKRRKKYGSGATKGSKIKDRVSINERPEYINNRSEFGHWEADLIIGGHHKKAMITLVERKSGFTIIKKVNSKNKDEVALVMCTAFMPFKNLIKSITFDNGLEFAGHRIVADKIECDTYFADPYSSWQRGTNENTNGLIRQYFPKGSNFDKFSDHDVAVVMIKLNFRPRKRLDFFTPFEILYKRRVALVS